MSRALAHAMMLRASPDQRPIAARVDARRAVPRRVSTPRRWVRKLVRGLPDAVAAFRRTSGLPLDQPKVGSGIVLPHGTEVGRVEEVIIGQTSGRRSYAVSDSRLPEGWVLLIPSSAIDQGEGSVLVLTDPKAPVAVPREVAPAV